MSTIAGDVPPVIAPLESKSSKKKRKKGAKVKAAQDTEQQAACEAVTEATEEAPESSKPSAEATDESEHEDTEAPQPPPSTATSVEDDTLTTLTNGMKNATLADSSSDATARFEELVKDRDALRAEVTHLRKSIEQLQAKHDTDLSIVKDQLQDTQSEKENAEEQYQNLLGKVNTIRSQLGERLKADKEDLEQARTRIEELEEQTSELQEQYTAKSAEFDTLTSEVQTQNKELSSLRNRANLSQQNWVKEREELVEQEAYVREEFENAKQAMHDWEVLAMEERSVRKDLGEKVGDLEEQVSSLQSQYERAASERDSQSTTVDGLQNALQEIQTARKMELRELVESSQTETESLQKQLQDAEKASSEARAELESTKNELERALPFEKEVKEKNLLIGKLRHEAVILSDHLTKALRFLRKGKPEDNVDRQIVTNHFLHFLALDRSDPKKFQVLQLIGALLGWSDEQREQAGLSRPGALAPAATTTGSLRLPGSPLFHRAPSTPSLASGDYFQESGSPATKESLAELWQNFLQQEAQGGDVAKGGRMSRKSSMAQSVSSEIPRVQSPGEKR